MFINYSVVIIRLCFFKGEDMRHVLYSIGFLFVDGILESVVICNYLFTVHNVLLDEQLTRAPTPIHYRLLQAKRQIQLYQLLFKKRANKFNKVSSLKSNKQQNLFRPICTFYHETWISQTWTLDCY